MRKDRAQNVALRLRAVSALTVAAAVNCNAATEECGNWLQGDGLPGLNGVAWAATTWDPDGMGPQPELFVVGGSFTVAGTAVAKNVAAWDGMNWQPLGSGLDNTVFALAVYDGKIVAAGDFLTAGGTRASRIAQWDGSTWQPVGSGMNAPVLALAIHNDHLVAGGHFTAAGAVGATRIAQWDGVTWQPIGSGMNSAVRAAPCCRPLVRRCSQPQG